MLYELFLKLNDHIVIFVKTRWSYCWFR